MCDGTLDDATRGRLLGGEVLIEGKPVEGSAIPAVHLRAMIPAPPERVWPFIDRCGEYARVLPGVKKAEELSREGEVVRARVTVSMPFPLRDLTAVTEAVHTVIPGERYQRKWKMLEGDYHSNSGSWTFFPFPGDPQRTLVIYHLHAEPKIALPSKLRDLATRMAFRRLIERLRELSR